jgi:RNA polymerase sigma factor (sigma-70 family)
MPPSSPRNRSSSPPPGGRRAARSLDAVTAILNAPGPADIEDDSDDQIAEWVQKAQHRALDTLPALSALQRKLEQYPQLSDDKQLELVRIFQAGAPARAELDQLKAKAAARGRATGVEIRRTRQLHEQLRDADRAGTYVVGSSWRLVWLICREKAEQRYGRERALAQLPDLIAEGNVAVTEALGKYDPTRGPRFSTYAARVVRDRIVAILSQDGHVHMAASWARAKRILSVRIPVLKDQLGRAPTEDEIRDDMMELCMRWAADKLTPEQQQLPADERERAMLHKLRKQGMLGAIKALPEVLQLSQSMASLNAPVGDADGSTLGELVASDEQDMLEDIEHQELSAAIAAALSTLSEREQAIMRLRFGLDPTEGYGVALTYQVICDRFGVTAERIRQIERSVSMKLRTNPATRSMLASFLPSQDGTIDP